MTQTEGNDDSWLAWDDDVDIAFTQITKVSLGGYVFDTNSVTDAYMKIHTLLYDLDPTKYHNSNFNWFHTNENAFRTAGKIADNAYVEKNFSSPDKMKVIRTVAKAFGLSPADLRLQLKPIKETDAQQDGLFDETN